MHYMRLYTDPAGASHFQEVDVDLTPTDFAPPAPPLHLSAFIPSARFAFLGAPSGWYGDWHPAPRRQMFFVLAGEFECTASDGATRRFPAGSALLMEDTSGKGHATRVVSEQDALAAVVQLE